MYLGDLHGAYLGVATGGAALTPADSDLSTPVRAIWVGTQGNLRVTTVNGDDFVLPNAVGLIPLAVRRVWATNTTATGIVGLV